MIREIEFDEEALKVAMKANDSIDEAAILKDALRIGLKGMAQVGIRKLFGKVEFWDDVIEDRIANSLEPQPTEIVRTGRSVLESQ